MKDGYRSLRIVLPRVGVGLVVLAVLFSATGCEPLRKKFVRKSKEAQTGKELIPVMVPEEYPAAVQSSAAVYRQNYSLVLVWIQEMTIAVQEQKTDKKVQSCFNKVKAQLDMLRSLLVAGSQEKVDPGLALLKELEPTVDEQASLRNNMLIIKRLRELDRMVRRNLRPAVVSSQIVKEVPAQP